jgi:abnormal spindle-like microcephaly-associated protein
MRAALKTFIVTRVLSDETVLAKYTRGRCNIPSGKFEKQYRAEIGSLVLYRLMVLIFFLDQAKMENVLDKVPRLFAKGASVKSSQAVLLTVCRDFLSAEGSFIKHLSRIGLTVSYKQDPIDELEFNITNLATDLRDGVRLTRMTEIITEAPVKALMTTLRLPAVSRLQKLHNVNVTLSTLKDFGIIIPEDVNSYHIVDGHREIVLKLMWSVISHCCMTNLLEGNQVEAEIGNVIRSNQARRKVKGLVVMDSEHGMNQPHASDASPEDILKSLLFRWCQAVCSSFGLQLSDFTTSFADGKALCLLVHYYHPTVIRLDEILPTSNDESGDLSPEEAIQNERINSTMSVRRVSELGGIPKMLPVSDTNNPPNEKSMLSGLSYLCSRLMESSKEIFATILIQACYRKYRSKVLLERKQEAARFIYQSWNEHKDNYYRSQQRRYATAVATLEDFVISHRHSLVRLKQERLEREGQQCAAIEIQVSYERRYASVCQNSALIIFRSLISKRCFRGSQGRSHAFELWERQQASIAIQCFFRRRKAEYEFIELFVRRGSSSSIQRIWRGYVCRQEFTFTRYSAIDIQRVARGFLTRNEIKRQHYAALTIQQAWWDLVTYWDMQRAATIIQSKWRGVCGKRKLDENIKQRDSAVAIQRIWRGYYQSIMYAISIESSILIQKVGRGFLARKRLPVRRCRNAAIAIQGVWRGFSAQVQYQLDLLDIISIQNLVRQNIAKKERIRRAESVATLQGAVRCALARRALWARLEEIEIERQRYHASITCQVSFLSG